MFNISSTRIDELNQLIQNVTKERSRYNENKILVDVLFECTKASSKLSSELRTKVYNILMAADVEQCLDLNLKESRLLGIDISKQSELTYEEKETLKTSVENGVIKKSRKLAKDLGDMGISMTPTKQLETRLPLDLNHEEKTLIDLQQSLNERRKLYVEKLQELLEIYESIIKIRTEVLPELANKVVADCEIQTEVHRLKSELLDTKTRVDIFTEEKESMAYYKLVSNDIIQQQEDCKAEIERLKVLQEKYKQVSCKQYDEILHSYIKYKCGVDIKKGFVNPLVTK